MQKLFLIIPVICYVFCTTGCGSSSKPRGPLEPRNTVEVTHSLDESTNKLAVFVKVRKNVTAGRPLKTGESASVEGVTLNEKHYDAHVEGYFLNIPLKRSQLKSQIEMTIKLGDNFETKIYSQIPEVNNVSIEIKNKKINDKQDLLEFVEVSETNHFMTCLDYSVDEAGFKYSSARMVYKTNLTLPPLSDIEKFEWKFFLQHIDAKGNFKSESLYVYQEPGECIASPFIFFNLVTKISGTVVNKLSMRARFGFERKIESSQLTILESFQILSKDHIVF